MLRASERQEHTRHAIDRLASSTDTRSRHGEAREGRIQLLMAIDARAPATVVDVHAEIHDAEVGDRWMTWRLTNSN